MHVILKNFINQIVELREDRAVVGDHDVGQGEGSHCTVVTLDGGPVRMAGCCWAIRLSTMSGNMANDDRYGVGIHAERIIQSRVKEIRQFCIWWQVAMVGLRFWSSCKREKFIKIRPAL